MIDFLQSIFLQIPTGGNGIEGYLGHYVRVVDIVLAFFILWGAFKGWQKGFIIEMISTLIFVFGVLLLFYAITQLFMATDASVGEAPKLAKFTMYFVFYIVGSLALNKLSRVLQSAIDYSIFDSFDNFMAMILGGLKYAIFLAIFIGLLDTAGLRISKAVTQDSFIYPMLLDFQKWLVEVAKILAPGVAEIDNSIKKFLQ